MSDDDWDADSDFEPEVLGVPAKTFEDEDEETEAFSVPKPQPKKGALVYADMDKDELIAELEKRDTEGPKVAKVAKPKNKKALRAAEKEREQSERLARKAEEEARAEAIMKGEDYDATTTRQHAQARVERADLELAAEFIGDGVVAITVEPAVLTAEQREMNADMDAEMDDLMGTPAAPTAVATSAAPSGIEAMAPKTAKDFKALADAILKKCAKYETSTHYQQLVMDLSRDLCINMELEKIREVIKNVEVLRSEKQKAKTKAAKTAKKNKKPTIGGMNSNKTGGGGRAYEDMGAGGDYDEYNFM